MGSIKLVNGKGRTVAAVMTCAVLALAATRADAGSLTPPAGPTDAGSAMYTIGDVYQRLSSGAAGTKRGGAFAEPTDIGATMHTLDEVMALAPALDAVNGAAVSEVCSGRIFWGLRSGGWGRIAGTGACPPIFLDVFGPFSVVENTTAGDVGTPVTATGSGVTYSIVAGNTGGVFAIDAGNGQITRSGSGSINYENARSYLLTVRATIGTSYHDVGVTVNVTDVNDVAPVFLAGGPFSVAENSAVDTAVGKVVATDADSATLTYGIDAAGNPLNAFKINSGTGQISVATAVLNFEATPGYTLTVRASDGTNVTSVAVTVAVGNVNEPPAVATANASVTGINTVTITPANLAATDTESAPAAALIYTVTSFPTRGDLEVQVGGTWTTVTSRMFFTQADVAANRVRYSHPDTSNNEDSLTFTLSDSQGGSVSGTLGITVN